MMVHANAALTGILETFLEDGTRLCFRRISPDDKPRLVEGLRHLSPESRYRRFFQHIDHFTQDQLRYLTEVDFRDHFAWIATLPEWDAEPAAGVGRWVRINEEPDVAEAAVTVRDDFHGRGIGKTLLWLLAYSALQNDVSAFRAWVLGDNRPMLQFLRDLGVRYGRWETGSLEVTVPLPDNLEELEATPAPLLLRAVASGALIARADPARLAATRLLAPADTGPSELSS